MMKCVLTVGLFILLPISYRFLLNMGLSRQWYALLTSILLGLAFLFLSILFVEEDALLIGGIMFVTSLIGGYPTQYLLYPKLRAQARLK